MDRLVRSISPFLDEFFGCTSDIFCDLAQKNRRKVPTAMIRYGRLPPIRMSKLPVGTPLPNLLKAHPLKYTNHFAWSKDGKPTHKPQTVSV